jgi:hypothetical protein
LLFVAQGRWTLAELESRREVLEGLQYRLIASLGTGGFARDVGRRGDDCPFTGEHNESNDGLGSRLRARICVDVQSSNVTRQVADT